VESGASRCLLLHGSAVYFTWRFFIVVVDWRSLGCSELYLKSQKFLAAIRLMDSKCLDLNPLVTLEALLVEQSVTKAAARLHLIQPAVSARPPTSTGLAAAGGALAYCCKEIRRQGFCPFILAAAYAIEPGRFGCAAVRAVA
jgi:hypothetical protein